MGYWYCPNCDREVRRVRSCETCHCYTTYPYGGYDRCQVNPDTEEMRRDYIHETVSQDADGDEWTRIENDANTKNPCIYHLTAADYRELIESGAV